MRYEFDWSDLVAEDFQEFEWIQMGEHDRRVLNDLYQGYEDCTQWLLIRPGESVALIPCAEDKSSPCDVPFEEFCDVDGTLDFRAVAQQLRDDLYYEDVE